MFLLFNHYMTYSIPTKSTKSINTAQSSVPRVTSGQ